MPRTFSVVVPVYNEAESLVEICDRVQKTFAAMAGVANFEILFVNDGSKDLTDSVLTSLCTERSYVRKLTFRRNYGKSLALMAGFQNVDSDIVVTLDGDLQDLPEEIPLLLAKLDEGHDLVTGWRQKREDQNTRKLGSWLFNKTVTKATGLDLHDLNCGFKIFTREAVAALCLYGDYHRFIPVQAHLAGFKVGEVPVSNGRRKHGESKYRTFRYQGFFDLLSLLFIHRYGLSPLHFFGVAAAIFILPSLTMLSYFVVQQVLYLSGAGAEHLVLNRPLFALSLTALMVGVTILFTGFVCDFILHHNIRGRIKSIIVMTVRSETPARPADNSDD